MRRGENPSRGARARSRRRVEELNERRLCPRASRIVPFYDRQFLVDNTCTPSRHSVAARHHAGGAGAAAVPRPAVDGGLVALTIPFSLLFALVLMYLTNIPIGLLSIGAIDFGIIVDGAVIMAENIAHRLGAATGARRSRRRRRRTVLGRGPRGGAAGLLLGAHDHRRLPAAPVADEHRGAAVPADGADDGLRPARVRCSSPCSSCRCWRRSSSAAATASGRTRCCTWFRPLYARHPARAAARLAGWSSRRRDLRLSRSSASASCRGSASSSCRTWTRGSSGSAPTSPKGRRCSRPPSSASASARSSCEFPDVEFITVQSGRNDSGTDPFPPNRLEMMIGPKPRDQWTQFADQAGAGRRHARAASATSSPRRGSTSRSRSSTASPRTPTAPRRTWRSSSPAPTRTCCSELARQDGRAAEDGARRRRRQHRAGRAAAAARDPARPRAVRPLQRPDRGRRSSSSTPPSAATRSATLYEGERRFDIVAKFDRDVIALAPGGRPAAGLQRRRRSGAAVAGRRDRARRRPDDDRPRERPAPASRSAATSSAATRAASSTRRRSSSTQEIAECREGYRVRLARHVREPRSGRASISRS